MIVRGKYVFAGSDFSNWICDGAVVIKDGYIIEIGDWKTLCTKYPDEKIVGDGSQILMPGMIDSHTHGNGISFAQKGIKYDFLENCMAEMDFSVCVSPQTNSMLNACRHIHNGCTTIHHNNWVDALDDTEFETDCARIEAYKKTGVRLAFSLGTRNENVLAYGEEEFLKTLPIELRERAKVFASIPKERAANHYFDVFDQIYKKYNSDSVRVFLGPNWVQGSTDEMLQETKHKSDSLGGTPIHIHTLQTPVQKAYGIRRYGKSLVEHLQDLGLVDRNLVLGHAVFLTKEDAKMLGECGASITHHPSCNLAVRNGIAPIKEYLRNNINVTIGIDEKGINDDDDIFMELRMAFYLSRINSHDPEDEPLKPSEIFKMATINASRVCGYCGDIGSLDIGKRADMILVNCDSIMNKPWSDKSAALDQLILHRTLGRFVDIVIVNGEIIMEHQKILTIDEDELFETACREAELGQTKEQREKLGIMREVIPYRKKYYKQMLETVEFEPFYQVNSKI